MVVILALLSAAANGGSTVLQRVAAAAAPPSTAMRLSLLGYLLHRRIWLAGFAALVASFLLQAAALDRGALSVVQPLLLAKLPITLLMALVVFRARVRVGVRDVLALAAMTGGLVLIVVLAAPSSSPGRPTTIGWVLAVAAAVVVTAALVGVAAVRPGPMRAAVLGAASGLAFGLTAAFIKGVTDTLAGGPGALFLSWFPYATAVAGLVAMLLQQSSLQAGSLAASQPASTIVGTLVSVLIGIALFDEQVRIAGVWPAELLGVVLVVAAVFATAHSPLVSATIAAGTDKAGGNGAGGNGTGTDGTAARPAGKGTR